MENKANSLTRFHEIIKTKHVFIEDDQVLMKRDTEDLAPINDQSEDWYPINFQWIPVVTLADNLK